VDGRSCGRSTLKIHHLLEALNGELGRYLCVDAVLIPPDAAVVTLLVTDLGLVGSQTLFEIGACGFPAGSFLRVTRHEAEQCNALVRQKGAEAGLVCGPPRAGDAPLTLPRH
jgi:hypothetical protein